MLTPEQRSRLEITGRIFEGTNSVVYATREAAGRPRVVLKVLKTDVPRTREIVRFHQEWAIARRVESPYVAKVHRLLRDDNLVALEVEDIGAQSLAQCFGGSPAQLREGLDIGIDLCRGLRNIHAAHVAHKDISSHNVLWNRERRALKIIDFGIASLLGSDLVQPESPQNLEGNLAYMSPEQTGRMNRPLDYRTDLYSLGVTLFELFTGRLPFVSSDPLELIHCHVARPPPDPRSLRPDLPGSLAQIITRLLSKSAEDRYQSAEGVEHDLAELLRRLDSPALGTDFPLGRQDRPIRFILPARLYGREGPAARLTDAFARVRAGAMVLTMVSGYSGVGKTSLVRELYRPLAAARGRYISGKYDQYQRAVPYSALASAFDVLCGQLVAEPQQRLAQTRDAVLAALGQSGQVLIDVIPRLVELIGPQPAVPKVDPQAAKNRFNEMFGRLVAAVSGPDSPLVVFLDDLQWADLASLELLELLVVHMRHGGVHLVGAYRDNEVEASHPLQLTLDAITKAGQVVEEIHLGNLEFGDLSALVSESLSMDPADVAELVAVIRQRTLGNAFFATEFFKSLATERLITYNGDRWVWDITEIGLRTVTANVVDFMAGRIRLFEAPVQAVLQVAACVGNSFDLGTVGVIVRAGERLDEIMAALKPAIEAGVILPLGGEYKRVGIVDVAGAEVRFRFQHDRVQQAAYSLIPQAERAEVHHRIGRRLLDHAQATDSLSSRLFEIVGHLNHGLAALSGPADRLELARLNHLAGLKAMDASAYHAATDYLQAARGLLPDGAFDSEYRLALDVHLDLARSLYINGRFDDSGPLYPQMLAQVKARMDEVRVRIVEMDDHHLQGDYDRAIAVQRAGLACLGIEFPDDLEAAIAAEVSESRRLLAGREIEALLDAPELRSEAILAALRLLAGMWMSAYLVSRDPIVQWCSIRMSNLTLEHGNSPFASFAYVQYAYICALRLDEQQAGYRFGSLAIRLADRYDDIEMRGKVYFNFAIFVNHWTQHIGSSTELFRRAYRASVEGGDWTYAVYGAANIVSNLLIEGRPCLEVEREGGKYLEFLRGKAEVGLKSFFLGGAWCALLDLQGRTLQPGRFDCELLDEAEHLATLGQLPIVEGWFYSAKLRSLFIHRKLDEALSVAHKADIVRAGVPSQIKVPEAWFYSCLIITGSYADQGALAAHPEHEALLTRYGDQLRQLARHCPDNLEHKHLLVDAERARLEGRRLGLTLAKYEAAVQAAEAAGYANNAAVGRELKARYWLGLGESAYAHAELRAAYALYARWGASAKLTQLVGEFPQLAVGPGGVTTTKTSHHSSTRALTWDSLDLASINKAALAISSNLRWEDLLRATLPIVMENMGADRAILLLRRVDGWAILAEAEVQAEDGELCFRLPDGDIGAAAEEPVYCRAAVESAARERKILFIDSDALPAGLADDPYFAHGRRSSMACAPIAYHEDTLSVLYLENRQTSGAFTAARETTLSILLGQLAISMKNARLYGEVEGALAERVRELSRSNAELEQFAYVVSHDLQAPLRHISSHMKLIEKALGTQLSGRTRTSFGHVLNATSRMQELVKDMLSLSRLGRTELDRVELDIPQLVDELRTLFAPVIADRGATITVSGAHHIRADPRLIRQVFMNLVNNGLKFVPAERSPAVVVDVARTRSGWRIRVADNGVGFPEHGRDRAFQLFQRLHKDSEFEGTGLGLAICRKIVELHGGEIGISDNPDGGGRVEFTLPDDKRRAEG